MKSNYPSAQNLNELNPWVSDWLLFCRLILTPWEWRALTVEPFAVCLNRHCGLATHAQITTTVYTVKSIEFRYGTSCRSVRASSNNNNIRRLKEWYSLLPCNEHEVKTQRLGAGVPYPFLLVNKMFHLHKEWNERSSTSMTRTRLFTSAFR